MREKGGVAKGAISRLSCSLCSSNHIAREGGKRERRKGRDKSVWLDGKRIAIGVFAWVKVGALKARTVRPLPHSLPSSHHCRPGFILFSPFSHLPPSPLSLAMADAQPLKKQRLANDSSGHSVSSVVQPSSETAPTNITEDESKLYDRQIRLWGVAAQNRCVSCPVSSRLHHSLTVFSLVPTSLSLIDPDSPCIRFYIVLHPLVSLSLSLE